MESQKLTRQELAMMSEDELREYFLSRPYADLMVDFVFKKVFADGGRESKVSLIAFLNAVLPDKNIVDIEYQATEMLGDKPTSKKFILDLLCISKDDTRFIVEVQNYGMLNFFQRCAAYAARLFSEHGRSGSPYTRYTPVYIIALMSEDATKTPKYKLHKPEYDDKVVYRYDFAEKDTHEVPFETISLIFVELGKFTKSLDECITPMDTWFYLFKNLKDMTDYPVEIQSEAFDYIFKAANIKRFTDMDNSIYIHQLFAEMDELNRIYSAEVIGREDAMLNVAKKMKDKGIDMKTIIECTNLTVSQIENL